MGQRPENWGSILSLALLAVLTAASWLLSSLSLFDEGPRRAVSQDDLVSVVHGAVIRRADSQGTPFQEVQSERAEQLRNGEAHLMKPSLIVSPASGRTMRLAADHATINPRHTEVFLRGDVKLFQEPTSTEPFVRVNTDTLFYSSVENIARTDDPVRVTRGRSELHGVGMVARPNTGQITILSDTRMVMPGLVIEPQGRPGRAP